MTRSALHAVLALLLAAFPVHSSRGQTPAPSPMPDTQGGPLTSAQAQAARAYGTLLRTAKADPAHMDWASLRQAYAASPVYNPATGNTPSMRPEMAAAASGDWARAAALCEAALARNWMNMPAHFIAAKAYQSLGNQPEAAKHLFVTKAFLRGILAGGNGASPATAYPVLATIEEYIVLSVSHARLLNQRLVNEAGHVYDAMAFTRPPSPATGMMYFAIDTMFARETKLATGATLITENQIPQ